MTTDHGDHPVLGTLRRFQEGHGVPGAVYRVVGVCTGLRVANCELPEGQPSSLLCSLSLVETDEQIPEPR